MGGGGTIIIGGDDLIEKVKANLSRVAPFRIQHFNSIYALYKANEQAVTRDMQEFVLRCASDILDN